MFICKDLSAGVIRETCGILKIDEYIELVLN